MSSQTPFFNRWRICFILVIVASIAVYLPSLTGQKIWDDYSLLDGSGIGGGQSLASAFTEPFLGAYFRPLVSASFYLENQIWNGNPFFYHQTNILLHAAATAVLIGLLLLMFGSRRIALLGGLLFAVQPAQVSTVAWIGGRTDSLCSLLVLLFCYLLVLSFRRAGPSKSWLVAGSVLAFFAAMVTKEQIAVMVALVPLALRAFGSPRSYKDHLRLTAPYFAAAFLFAVLWLSAYPNPFKPMFRPALEQLATAGHATTYYALLLFAPMPRWMHTLSLGWFELRGIGTAIIGLALAAVFLYATARSHKRFPTVGWVVAFLLLSMLPVSNIVPLPSLLVAPYRAGVAGIAVAILLAFLIIRFKPVPRQIRYGFGALYVIACAGLSWWGAGRWSDQITLFGTVAEYDPVSIIARRNLSGSLMRENRYAEAESRLEEILTFLYDGDRWQDPAAAYEGFENDRDVRYRVKTNQGNLVEPEDWLGELFAQLGIARANQMDFEGSRLALNTGRQIDPRNATLRVALAQYAFFDKDYQAAYRHMFIAVAARPKEPKFRVMLAQGYAGAGLNRLAEQQYRKSISMQPWFGPTYLDLAAMLMKEGRLGEAAQLLSESKDCKVQDSKAWQEHMNKLASLEKQPKWDAQTT